ncbi:MAG: glycosyltransferase family 4 protein [Deltaproteobacteria bacterium]|nr:glycosyltransferase family 4 protein [Deltaproteobacteria bacterium]
MRVLLVSQVELDADSGSARHVLALASALAPRCDLTLIAPGEATTHGLRRVVPPFGFRPGARLELALAAAVVREIRRARPEVAYLRLSASSSAVAAVFRALAVPYFVELNGPVLDQLTLRGRPPWLVRIAERSLSTVVRGARAVVVASPALERHARSSLLADRVHVIENGVDLETVRPGDRALARAHFGVSPSLPWVGLVATLTPELRLDLLSDAFRRLGTPSVGLLIVGSGQQRSFVDRWVAESSAARRVLALGARSHAEAVLAMQASDVCVNPHDSDLALKGLEYAAVGRRQACFRVDGIERLLGLYSDPEAVVVARSATSEALAEALDRVLGAQRERGDLEEAELFRARRALGWETKAERLLALFGRERT